MAEIRWTAQAADDLEAIADFIALDSRNYASLFVIDVMSVIERLELFPERGRVVPEFQNPNVREVILGNYRIIYRFQNGIAEILTVYHGARLLDLSKLGL